ncbi:tRNA 2-thiocytidine(32) synthetase TtcA [Salinisphaera sp.]|uniref:tRNA 2-thiocytidine(32) synthetase TtcA n=1 Tax=Salinisphaera sp. TaxID=1914330 RepID=UPI002D769517|nr:tRNA 2-thiocytidine(32) synthetase TtcA [Salinisphaera sp.]HET7314145.1 tRNA 2-thiocytidine(32) synthetase TtcA [Salinisphaera sp.]
MSEITVLDTRPATGLTPGSNAANKLTKRLRRQAGQAIVDYGMIRDGERIMVCLSGGKDSYTLLDTLLYLRQVAPVSFTLRAVNLDQKQPGFPAHILPGYLRELGVDYEIIERDTYSVVTEKIAPGATLCGLCSRLRRGILYRYARENGFTRIALGHHRDDIVETMFLNMFHGARMAAMPPKLKSDDGDNVVIRPLAYCAEADIEKYARLRQFPIIPCNLCGSQENMARQNVKAMLADWERVDPGRSERIFRSITRIAPSQMADGGLFDFAGLEVDADRR